MAILLAGFSAGQVRVEATKDLPKLVIFLNNWWSSRLCVVGWPGSTSWGRLSAGWGQDRKCLMKVKVFLCTLSVVCFTYSVLDKAGVAKVLERYDLHLFRKNDIRDVGSRLPCYVFYICLLT